MTPRRPDGEGDDLMTVTAVDPILFASLDPPRLAGSRCATCGTVTFPAQAGCARCAGEDMAAVELADRGTLWTWTVQAFEPKAPYRVPEGGFTPYGVGYVDLGEVIIESRIVGDPAGFEIGLPMRLTLLPLWPGPDGSPVVTYAFQPAGEGV
jgi:uncharacterized OB-fold protein